MAGIYKKHEKITRLAKCQRIWTIAAEILMILMKYMYVYHQIKL